MALINKAKREINAKIIYYGRPGVGKNPSLKYIYERLKPSLRGEFKTMSTMGDSLHFFDFTPFETLIFGGYRLRFHLYTLTGPVANPAAWKMTLKGADGLVFVSTAATSTLQDEQYSLACLRDFVGSYGISLHDIPMVVQVGRDGLHEHLKAEDICLALGIPDVSGVLAQPFSGEGILETLSVLSQKVMKKIEADPLLSEAQPVLETVDEIVEPPELSENNYRDTEPELSITLIEEPRALRDGMLKIPIQITVAGQSRRLTVSISVEEE